MAKSKEKSGVLKGKTKGKPERKQNRKKRRILKTGLSGEQNEKNLSNCRKIAFLGLFTKHKRKTQRAKTEPPRNKKQTKKKQLFAFWQTTPHFW